VITARHDTTADLVVDALNTRNASVFRCDTTEFLSSLRFSASLDSTFPAWAGHIDGPVRRLDLADIRCAYYRRPGAFDPDKEFDEATRDWISLQARLGFGGVLAATTRWFNHPSHIGYAEYKPVQLAAAARAGLRLPRTLITNEPAAAVAFAEEMGEVVYKPLSTAATPGKVIYTNRVSAAQLRDETIAQTAHLFQEWITKQCEIRLVVVDDRYFATEIVAKSSAAQVDWRTDYAALSYRTVDTPREIRAGLSRLLREFDLRFAAVDFAVTPEGNWVFLDLNPNGQWAWIAKNTGVNIAGAIADALIATPL
jgi:ATP-grasp ribosomal peptide maturase